VPNFGLSRLERPLHSPHDPDATYRQKGGEEYSRTLSGYVVGISETCDPEAPVQLITDV
jgi:hypothetical protein